AAQPATRRRRATATHAAPNPGGGAASSPRSNPADPRVAFIESQEGRANRVDLTTLERQAVAPLPPERLKRGERERWNWNTPIALSAFDPKEIYMGSHVVFRSADRGANLKAVRPDPAAPANRYELPMMGPPVTDR